MKRFRRFSGLHRGIIYLTLGLLLLFLPQLTGAEPVTLRPFWIKRGLGVIVVVIGLWSIYRSRQRASDS